MQSPGSAGVYGVIASTSGVQDQTQALVPVGQMALVAAEPGGGMGVAAPALQVPVVMEGKSLQAPS